MSNEAEIDSKIAAAEQELDNLKQQQEALNKELDVSSISSDSWAMYCDFLSSRDEISACLAELKSNFEGFISGKHTDICGSWAATEALGSSWDAIEKRINAAFAGLETKAEKIRTALPNANVGYDGITEQWNDIQTLRSRARTAADDFLARCNATKEQKAELEKSRINLLMWCRQQKSNLDGLTDPEDVQEFCSSILKQYPTMEENFKNILEMAEPLLPDESLQRGLLEANEVWLNLQVGTYDRLRQALLEIHPKSKLEDEVREYSNFTSRVNEFLDTFHELVTGPSDPESEPYVRPAIEQCEAVKGEFTAYANLPKQLHDFSLRMETLRESYNNLRRAVLSRLTFLASAVPALTASMRRKEEYVARMKELKKWVDVKSQGETWRQIHDRILSIKALIEKEQHALIEAKAAQEAEQANQEVAASPTELQL